MFWTLWLSLMGCHNYDLPDLSTLGDVPSDQFILGDLDLPKVSRAFPFKGQSSGCDHKGAHLHFSPVSSDEVYPIYSPVDGIIDRIDECMPVTDSSGHVNDRYGISIGFAKKGDDLITFDLSFEPMAGKLCSDGSKKVNDFFDPYLKVASGDEVTKGQIIAYFYRPAGVDDGTHIHFNLSNQSTDTAGCPNIFSESIVNQFASVYGSETCNGASLDATFCYGTNSTEDFLSGI